MDLKTSEKVHTIGDKLNDIKFTANRDLKFDVADIKIEINQNEMVNIPRWIGQILEEKGLGEIDNPNMITELKQALSKEKMIGEYELSTLTPDFYIKLKAALKRLERYDFDNVESIMLELFRMRRGKIIKLADSTKLTAELKSKLTVEEKIFFETISENSKKFELHVRGNADE